MECAVQSSASGAAICSNARKGSRLLLCLFCCFPDFGFGSRSGLLLSQFLLQATYRMLRGAHAAECGRWAQAGFLLGKRLEGFLQSPPDSAAHAHTHTPHTNRTLLFLMHHLYTIVAAQLRAKEGLCLGRPCLVCHPFPITVGSWGLVLSGPSASGKGVHFVMVTGTGALWVTWAQGLVCAGKGCMQGCPRIYPREISLLPYS